VKYDVPHFKSARVLYSTAEHKPPGPCHGLHGHDWHWFSAGGWRV